MKFEEMTDKQFDEWQKLYDKYFDAHACWDVGCYGVDEQLFDDGDGGYDEFFVCDHLMNDDCPMFEKWKMMERNLNDER